MLQFCAAFIIAILVAIVAALIGGAKASGQAAGISALLGGLCYALPNALFALRLHLSTKKPDGANPSIFFIGEFLKLVIIIALLAAVVKLYHELNWPAFLIGFIVVLKSYFILLFKK
jgi:ATP synthase protein I